MSSPHRPTPARPVSARPASARPHPPRPAPLGRQVRRAAGLILVVTVLARIVGFLRYLVFGASVGGGDVGTAYASANLVPNVLFEVAAGGALAALVVPLVAGVIENPDRRVAAIDDADGAPDVAGGDGASARAAREASHLVSVILCWSLLITGTLTVALVLAADPLAELILRGGGRGEIELAARLLRVFALQLPLYAVAIVLGAFLQARRRFLWPALAPLLSSLVVIVSYRVYALLAPTVATVATVDRAAEAVLAWGTTAGVLAMALPLIAPAYRAGLRLRPAWRLRRVVARRALALAGAGFGAVGAQQLALAAILALAMRAGGTGTLPVFQYAQAVYLLPFAVLVAPLVTSVFPQLSEQRLVGDDLAFAATAASSLRTVAALAAPGGAGLLAAGPALEAFFQVVDRAAVQGVGAAVGGFALGLLAYAISTQCTRILSAALRARDALLVGSAGWLTATGLILALTLTSPTRRAAEAATAFALCIALGQVVSAALGLGRVSDLVRPSGQGRRLGLTVATAALAVLIGGIPGLILGRLGAAGQPGPLALVLLGFGCGMIGALLALAVVAIPEHRLLRVLLHRARVRSLRRVRRGRQASASNDGAAA
ncbi:hypothetical protein JSY14_11875 [Brachybacterium sp. EF45031]|uniref:lipid II flippase MurJ n=1 Tax=Brachybacterium sillae TaxID=2810536 RepID=UPI00217D0381|nr:lipid II flippase MurJ [Brachybacterium sillae]MCS6712682.1 hypothetical protein [Brachybacterium sillae]